MAQEPDRTAGAVQTALGRTMTLQIISAELATVSNWHALGVKLGVPGHELREIEQNHPNDSTRCKHEMVQKWLNSGRNCSWQTLSNALHEIGNDAVAIGIANNYLRSQQEIRSPERLGRSLNHMAVTIARSNIQTITGKFASVLILAKQKLKILQINIEDLRLHLIVKYSPSDSPDASASGNINTILGSATNIDAIFEALTTYRLWDYLNYHLLQSIVKEFASRDEELKLRVEQYQRDLTGFLLATKIQDYLEAVQSDPPAADNVLDTPNHGLFSVLSVKVDANITEHSLQYVYDLWQSLAAQFRLPTPALLFHKITEGCFTVAWRVLSNIVPYLHAKVAESSSFFHEKQIVKVSDQKEGLYSVKEKRRAKLGKHKKNDHDEGPRPKVSRRRQKCGACDGCKRSEDCGDCINCKDNPKRGGPGTRKKPCKLGQCNDLQDAKPPAVLVEATDGQWQLQQKQQQQQQQQPQQQQQHQPQQQQQQPQQQQQHQQLQHQEAMEKNDRAISTLQTASEQQQRALQHELSTLKQKHQEELEKKKEEILHLSATMTHQSTQLQSELKQLKIEMQERDKKNSELHQRLDQTLQQLKEKEKIALSLQNAAALQRQTLERTTHEIAILKQKNQREMQQKDKELAQLTSKSKQQVSQLEAQTNQLSKFQKQVQEKQTEISKLTNTIDNQLRKIENLDFQISGFSSEMQKQERQATEWKCWEGDVKGALESLSSVVYRRRQIKKEDSS